MVLSGILLYNILSRIPIKRYSYINNFAISMKTSADTNEMIPSYSSFPHKGSHYHLFESLDWTSVDNFWRNMMKSSDHPAFVNGDDEFGVTNLKAVNFAGKSQYTSPDPHYKRKTFAIRLGYFGPLYQGYQSQGRNSNTVQAELQSILNLGTIAAGRTDRDVSAVSQTVSFHTNGELTEEEVISAVNSSPFAEQGKLRVYECQRVPKKFHAQFSATWRRYLYLLPLTINPEALLAATTTMMTTDNSTELEVIEDSNPISITAIIPSNSNNNQENISSDLELTTTPTSHQNNTNNHKRRTNRVKNEDKDSGLLDNNNNILELIATLTANNKLVNNHLVIDIDFINQMFQRIQGIELPYSGLAYKEDKDLSTPHADLCTLYRARAFFVDLNQHTTTSTTATTTTMNNNSNIETSNNSDDISETGFNTSSSIDSYTNNNNNFNICSNQGMSAEYSRNSEDNKKRTHSEINNASPPINNSRHEELIITDVCDGFMNTKAMPTSTPTATTPPPPPLPSSLCIELVGTRFLRRMVRIIVATAVREALLPSEQRDVDVLYKICKASDKQRSAIGVPGIGLAMSGVGYNIADLSIDKFAPTNPITIAKRLAKEKKRLEEEKLLELELAKNNSKNNDDIKVE